MPTLGVIAARGGSKGLPGKNILELRRKPLVAWTVAAALDARTLNRVIISTDDPGIRAAAVEAGCDAPFLRPAELASDTARIEDSVIHALESIDGDYDIVVLLQATSPLRLAIDIDSVVEKLRGSTAPSCVAVTETAKSPYWMFRIEDDDRLKPLMDGKRLERRQALPRTVVPNGAVYAARTDWFREHRTFYSDQTIAYEMPPERSVDIDTDLDFAFCETLLTRH